MTERPHSAGSASGFTWRPECGNTRRERGATCGAERCCGAGGTRWVESPTNQVFAVIPNQIKPKVDEVCDCEVWCPYDESHTVIRFVTCFHTTQADVDGLLSALPNL